MADENKTKIQRGVSTVAEVEAAINDRAREEYVDAQDAATLTTANGYTDEQTATRETPVGAKEKADAAETTAKEYTDTREGMIRTDFASADTAALTTAKAYTDTKVAALVDGAPETLDTLKEVAEALKANEDGATAMMKVIGAKADAAATVAALAEKVEKVEGFDLMTTAERTKLAGVAEGANAYTLPMASAATLGGVKAGENVKITEDGTISATHVGGGAMYTIDFDLSDTELQKTNLNGLLTAYETDPSVQVRIKADPFLLTPVNVNITGKNVIIIANLLPPTEMSPRKAILSVLIVATRNEAGEIATIELWNSREDNLGGDIPAASSTVLGGVKIGDNLTVDAQGRLNATAGGGPGGNGGGILVLPYVAPEKDADGNLSNSAAFVAAWGPILSRYFAAPTSFALHMEMDVSGGEGAMVKMPCTAINIGSSAAPQWLLSGFAVVNMPATDTESVSCQATCTAVLVCNAAGEMQSIASYIQSGIIGPDGGPNPLGGGDAVIIELPFNNDGGAIDEAVLKAAIQPLLPKLMFPIPCRVIVSLEGAYFNGMFQIIGEQIVITAYGIHPYTIGDEGNTVIVRAGVIATIVNGTITTAQGFTAYQELVTTKAMNAALASKAALIPQSLKEQLVPGEFWMDADGVQRQVYIRTFRGAIPIPEAHTIITTGVKQAQYISGNMKQDNGLYDMPFNSVHNAAADSNNAIGDYLATTYISGTSIVISYSTTGHVPGSPYVITFKYTKA